MEAGEPAASLLQSLRPMCVTWPHVSWRRGCIPAHSCKRHMEFVLCPLLSQLQSMLQKKSLEGWDRSGPGWVLDISFNTMGEISIEKAMGHQVGYSLPESTRWDLGCVGPALTDCINSVRVRKQRIRQTLLCNCRWIRIWGGRPAGDRNHSGNC